MDDTRIHELTAEDQLERMGALGDVLEWVETATLWQAEAFLTKLFNTINARDLRKVEVIGAVRAIVSEHPTALSEQKLQLLKKVLRAIEVGAFDGQQGKIGGHIVVILRDRAKIEGIESVEEELPFVKRYQYGTEEEVKEAARQLIQKRAEAAIPDPPGKDQLRMTEFT